MKKLLMIFGFLVVGTTQAQFVLEDLDDDPFLQENGRTLFSANLKHPMEHVRIQHCQAEHTRYARPSEGPEAFRKELFRTMQAYIDKETYALNGTFSFLFRISTQGRITDVRLHPKVANSELLERDLKLIIRRLKSSWVPASCNGAPLESEVRLKVNFQTEFFDL